MRLEYLAANSALSFWKELLQSTNINTQLLQTKGASITNCYTRIQDVMKQIEVVMPHAISIICRYAVFLKRIVNNENESFIQYEKAVGIFQRMLSQKVMIDNGGDKASRMN